MDDQSHAKRWYLVYICFHKQDNIKIPKCKKIYHMCFLKKNFTTGLVDTFSYILANFQTFCILPRTMELF